VRCRLGLSEVSWSRRKTIVDAARINSRRLVHVGIHILILPGSVVTGDFGLLARRMGFCCQAFADRRGHSSSQLETIPASKRESRNVAKRVTPDPGARSCSVYLEEWRSSAETAKPPAQADGNRATYPKPDQGEVTLKSLAIPGRCRAGRFEGDSSMVARIGLGFNAVRRPAHSGLVIKRGRVGVVFCVLPFPLEIIGLPLKPRNRWAVPILPRCSSDGNSQPGRRRYRTMDRKGEEQPDQVYASTSKEGETSRLYHGRFTNSTIVELSTRDAARQIAHVRDRQATPIATDVVCVA